MASSTGTRARNPKRSHTLPPTTPLSQQVGGHSGVYTTEDESLLLKPALPREIAFYQFVRDVTDASTGLHPLIQWIPSFIGVLSLEGRLVDPTADIQPGTVPTMIPASEGNGPLGDLNGGNGSNGSSQTLVLQNLLYGYRKPCILDVKLGTILYDDDASEEKKARMIKKAAETTSLQTGLRLTGFQVYSNHSPNPTVYGKEYGYGLKPEQLQEGIANFFPCSISVDDDAKRIESNTSTSAGLPPDLLLTLLTSLHKTLIDLRKDLSGAHVRIVGGSVLIIYEGDRERALLAAGRGGGPADLEEMVSDDDDDDEQIEVEIDDNGQIIMDSVTAGLTETTSESSEQELAPRMFTVSLIDFAHTRVAPGEGPDMSILAGMDTLIRLIDERRQEVAALISGNLEGPS